MGIKEQAKLHLDRREVWGQIRVNEFRGDREIISGFEWGTYGESIHSYNTTFVNVLQGSIYEFLTDKPSPVVIDLMGPSETIAGLFEDKFQDKPKFGLAVSLNDLRTDEQKKRDEKLNIIQIAGDILRPSTWHEIEEKLRGRRADLIVERAVGGLDCIPRDPIIFALLLRRVWRLLSKNNGILIAELPNNLETQAEKMIDVLKGDRVDGLIAPAFDMHGTAIAVKIVKTPDSPEKLSFLR